VGRKARLANYQLATHTAATTGHADATAASRTSILIPTRTCTNAATSATPGRSQSQQAADVAHTAPHTNTARRLNHQLVITSAARAYIDIGIARLIAVSANVAAES
jgi:hypothetical protein